MPPHLTDEELDRLLANHLTLAEQDRIGRHLKAGCGLCSRRLVKHAPDHFLQQAAEKGIRKAGGIRAFRDQLLAVALDQNGRWKTDEQALARSLDLLRAKPEGYDALTFRQVHDLQGQTLVKALLQRSFELRFADAPGMRWLAYNAVKAAEGLRPEEQEPTDLFDLQARAWAELGNAYRINDQFAEAEAAFSRSRASLRKGTGDLHLLARAADLEASLRSSQRRLPEANELLGKVHRLYLTLGNHHLAGRALISKGRSTHENENHSQALSLFRKGLASLDFERDPQLFAVGQQGLLHALIDCGELHEAGRLLLASGLRQNFGADPIFLLKIRIVEGKLLAGLGKFSRAERVLSGVGEEFRQRGQHYEAAIVGLNLVSVWLQQGNFGRIQATAKDAYATFRELGIWHEAAKAQRYLN